MQLPGMQQKVQLYVVHPAFSVKFATSDRALWERGCCDVVVGCVFVWCIVWCMVWKRRVVKEREREREKVDTKTWSVCDGRIDD